MRRLEAHLPWGLALWLAACATGVAGGETAADEPDPTLDHARSVKAAERAPDLWAESEAAAERARSAASDEAAQDYTTEARLWRQAAIAEAERIVAIETLAELEQRAEGQARELAKLQLARADLHARADRLAAGRLALEEVTRVLQLAQTEPRRRPSVDAAALRRGTLALIDRATLVSAAARELGADAKVLDAIEARLKRARTQLDAHPETALHLADEALFDAQAALGPVRGERVDAATAQSLVDALQAAGLDPRRGDRGLTARLTSPAPGGVLPRRGLARLCKLRAAFPAGAWQVALRDPHTAGIEHRAAAVKKQLTSLGCPVDGVASAGAAGLEQTTLEVSFLAY